MIEQYAVPPGEDDAFLAAYAADAPPGHTLYRALRDDAPYRYVSVSGPPRDGALAIAATDAAQWATATAAFAGRQGYLGAERHGELGLAHWSSPLMYARTINALGELLPGAKTALYARV
ncbi:hypothetical protein OJ997_17480 [Solirubrobacter phytolaccae]|uniref:Uncharacterized protein n=1 Tax=Solirubrobacter phytolaccae TaxID=1404360 RepID=A0A9X3N9X2_9ACTN|nr:hypothetical protein [Solirubrobacter phytolaccae]MDA0182101.1 hypothetical protein [Solirubrobacter phytolaccae]